MHEMQPAVRSTPLSSQFTLPDANLSLTLVITRARIQKLKSDWYRRMRDHEYRLLDAIARDPTLTQASLAVHLGVAVGSVNWYIKGLIGKGYIKVSRMERTRLKYHLTPRGAMALTRRTAEYVDYSLDVYRRLRKAAIGVVGELQRQGVQQVALSGDGDAMDILRLTCIEHGISPAGDCTGWAVESLGRGYEILRQGEPSARDPQPVDDGPAG